MNSWNDIFKKKDHHYKRSVPFMAKKRGSLFFVLSTIFISFFIMLDNFFCLASGDDKDKMELYAMSAVLLDGESGRVLYGKKENEPMANASTTKIMTCILILEECDPEERVSISAYAASMPKVNAGLRTGESYSVKELLYSMMLESHNDSAAALAEHLGKNCLPELSARTEDNFSKEESKSALKVFAKKMNEKAKEIGCEDTYFITPNGLDATESIKYPDGTTRELEHHTTAKDLAKILSYCILRSPQKELFLMITRSPSYVFTENGRSFSLQNHNAFLNMMEGAVSGKTGFTGKAGYCYAGAVERDGRVYVAALLACGWPNNKTYKWKDMRKLMDYGIGNYRRVELSENGALVQAEKLPEIQVKHAQGQVIGEEVWIKGELPDRKKAENRGVLLSEEEKLEIHIAMRQELEAPIRKGEKLGEIRYGLGQEVFLTENILAPTQVLRINFAWCLTKVWEIYLHGICY